MENIFQNVSFMTVCVTEKCNATCTYCYIPAKYTRDDLKPEDWMALDTIEKVGEAIFYNPGKTKRIITLQFHGGEPLLVGIDWYTQAIPKLKSEAAKNNVFLKLKMQSNFISMNDDFARFLKDNNIEVNISLDGPPEINDQLRSGGEATVSNLKRYIETTGLHPGLIAVIGQHNCHIIDKVLRYFYYDLQLKSANFQWVQAIGRGRPRHCLDPHDQISGAIQVINFMHETNGDFTETYTKRFIRMYFDPQFRSYDRGRHGCEGFYCMAWDGMVSISSKGEIIGCDTLFGQKDLRGLFIDEYVSNKNVFIEKFHAKKRCCHSKSEWWARCESCAARAICNFGCPSEYHSTDYGKEGNGDHCTFIVGVYNYIKQNEKRLSSLYRRFVFQEYEVEKSQIEGSKDYVEAEKNLERKERLQNVVAIDTERNMSKKYRLERLKDILSELDHENLEFVLQNSDIVLARSLEKKFIILKKTDELFEVDELTFERIKSGEQLYNQLLTN